MIETVATDLSVSPSNITTLGDDLARGDLLMILICTLLLPALLIIAAVSYIFSKSSE